MLQFIQIFASINTVVIFFMFPTKTYPFIRYDRKIEKNEGNKLETLRCVKKIRELF